MKQINQVKNAIVILCCLSLSACVPGGSSQTARFYNLTAENSAALSEKVVNPIGVLRIQMPKFMDKPQISSQNKGSSEVSISEYNRWIEPLSILYTRTLVENISILLPNAPTKIATGTDSFSRIVFVDVVKSDAVWNDKATLEAWYTIKTGSGQILCNRKFADSVLIKNDYESLVKAHSKLLGNLSKAIAESIAKN